MKITVKNTPYQQHLNDLFDKEAELTRAAKEAINERKDYIENHRGWEPMKVKEDGEEKIAFLYRDIPTQPSYPGDNYRADNNDLYNLYERKIKDKTFKPNTIRIVFNQFMKNIKARWNCMILGIHVKKKEKRVRREWDNLRKDLNKMGIKK